MREGVEQGKRGVRSPGEALMEKKQACLFGNQADWVSIPCPPLQATSTGWLHTLDVTCVKYPAEPGTKSAPSKREC